VLEVKDEFCITLCDIITDSNMQQGIRQLASVVLKHYIEIHWTKLAEKFVEPETPERVKEIVRHALPAALSDPETRIRSTVAYAISAIAQWDWPEAWPDLLDRLVSSLSSGEPNLIHGVLSVLTEFSSEVTDMQMPHVAPLIFPHLYNIITNVELYSIQNRGKAVEIFNSLSTVIGAMTEIHKDAAATLLFPVLPQFLQAFIQCFSLPDGPAINSALKKDILEAITGLTKLFPSQVSAHFTQLLTVVWNLLTSSADRYVRTKVNSTDVLDDAIDSDADFEHLIYTVFFFIETLMSIPKLRLILKRSLDQLMQYLIIYLQMTDDQVSLWLSDPNQFVEDEDEDTMSYSVRISAENLLLCLCDDKQLAYMTARAVTVAITHHIESIKNSQMENWKMYEACMLVLGDVADIVSTGKTGFDVLGFLSSVVLKQLTLDVSPFLIGRCLWLGSKFAAVMPPDLSIKFVEACVSGLGEPFPPAVRISAVRSLKGFCSHLEREAMHPYLTAALNELVTLATQSSDFILELVLDVMLTAIQVDQQLTASLESRLSPLVIALFLKYGHDPSMMPVIEELFSVLSGNPLVLQPLQACFIPTLISILKSPQGTPTSGLLSSSMDVLVPIIRKSNPLDSIFVTEIFPLVINNTINTDDNTLMQTGCDCVRAYVAKAADQLAVWQDESGHNGIEYVVEVVSQLLQPGRSEYSALLIGRLISTLVHKAGRYLSGAIEPLLQSVLSKLQQAHTQSVIQSLLVVFAQLMISQLESVLEFLESVPSPTGDSALQFVLTSWCQWQPYFFGAYETKVSVVALGKLLEFGVKRNNRQLWDIAVKGEELVSESKGIRTRSKARNLPG
jgi:hypothetical protein